VRKLWLVARFTFREAVRRKFLLVLALGGLAVVALFGIVSSMAWAETAGRLPLVQAQAMAWVGARLILSVLNILAAVAAIFLASGGIGPEVENGSMHLLLTRTVTRTQVFLGKLLGTVALVVPFCLLLTAGVGLALMLAGPGWPPGWHWVVLAFPLGPVLLAAAGLGLSTRFSTIPAGLATLMLYGTAQIGTMLETLGSTAGSGALGTAGIVISLLTPVDAVYRWMLYKWTDAIGIVGALIRTAGLDAPAPSGWMLLWTAGWVVAVLAVGGRAFRTRDL
jgi:Cu-processing system permease protein